MKPHVLMVTLLLVTTIVVDVVTIPRTQESHAANIATIALLVAQVNLLALWAGLGLTHWLLRVVLLGVGIAAFSAELGHTSPDAFRTMASLFGLCAGMMFFLAVFGRLAGFRWTLVSPVAPDQKHANLQPMQFSLAQMFSWTTVAAVVAALAGKASLAVVDVPFYIALFATNAVIALVAASIVSFSRRILTVLALVILIALVSALLFNIVIAKGRFEGYFFALYVLHALFIAGWFSACRLVGIRIVRYRRAGPAEARAASSP